MKDIKMKLENILKNEESGIIYDIYCSERYRYNLSLIFDKLLKSEISKEESSNLILLLNEETAKSNKRLLDNY